MNNFREHVKESSKGFYLTLISVIQSLAIGYMLSTLDIDRLFGSKGTILYWLQCIAIFQIIVIVWHEYAMGTVFFKWILNIFDSIIPFLFGISQYSLIAIMNKGKLYVWFYGMSFFALIALFAYLNQYLKVKRNTGNEVVTNIIGRFHVKTLVFVSVSLILFFTEGFISYYFQNQIGLSIALLVVANIVLVVLVIQNHFVYSKIFQH